MTIADLLTAVTVQRKPDGSYSLTALRTLDQSESADACRLIAWLNWHLARKPEVMPLAQLSRN